MKKVTVIVTFECDDSTPDGAIDDVAYDMSTQVESLGSARLVDFQAHTSTSSDEASEDLAIATAEGRVR